jgi:hypothetical protein
MAEAITPALLEIDFAHDELPDLHQVLDRLRPLGPVVRVVSHGLVSRPFFPKQVRALLEPLLEGQADALPDAIEGRERVDMVEAFARPCPFKVITRMLGIPVHDDGQLLSWALKIIDFPWDPEGAPRAKAEFDAYLPPLIARRRARPEGDVISILATAGMRERALAGHRRVDGRDSETTRCAADGLPLRRSALTTPDRSVKVALHVPRESDSRCHSAPSDRFSSPLPPPR